MKLVYGGESTITFSFPSEQAHVQLVLRESEKFFRKHSDCTTSGFEIALRELLNNAVEHGNRNDRRLNVYCTIELLGERYMKITVEDEGAGFDYRSLDMTLPDDPTKVRDRGYTLVNAYSEELEFNEKGNRVTALIRLYEANKNGNRCQAE